MTYPETTVEIQFTAASTATMIWDDPTRGVWDSGWTWAGDTWNDVSDRVRSVSMRRGRSQAQDKYPPATGAVVFDNRDRALDPFNVSSAYLGAIKKNRPIRVRTSGYDQFNGFITNWSLGYDVSGDSVATASITDGFTLLASRSVDGLTVGTAVASDRVSAVLDYGPVAWSGALRNIETSTVALAAGTPTGNALNYLQQVETVEAGSLFINRSGVLNFLTRLPVGTATSYTAAISYTASIPYADYATEPTTDLTFTDDLTASVDVGYAGIGIDNGGDVLRNLITITRGTAASITAEDSASQTEHGGVVELTVDGSMLYDDAAGTALANHLLGVYAWPEARVSDVTVNVHAASDAVMGRLLSLDIADVVPVRFQPNSTGEPIEGYARIEGVESSITKDLRHVKTFRLTTVQGA